MRQLQTLIAALLSVFILMTAGIDSSYAQSQYRRQSSNERKSNSEYRPAQNNQQTARPAQNTRPSQAVRPSQNTRPNQSTRPSQNTRPNQSVRPSQNSRPAQNVRPQQNSRPNQNHAVRPSQGNRPSQNVRPSARPGNNHNHVAPPAGHFRPEPHKGLHGKVHMRPRPSVHFYGYYTHTLPFGAKIIHRGPYDYYYASGRYYRYINNVYVISRPPVGAIIAKSILNGLLRLTDYAIRDAYGRTQRYYTDDDGVYYVKSGSNYIVVDPPIGAIVYELPYGFEEVTINGTRYYQVDDNFYELVYNGPQDYYFRVVGTLGR